MAWFQSWLGHPMNFIDPDIHSAIYIWSKRRSQGADLSKSLLSNWSPSALIWVRSFLPVSSLEFAPNRSRNQLGSPSVRIASLLWRGPVDLQTKAPYKILRLTRVCSLRRLFLGWLNGHSKGTLLEPPILTHAASFQLESLPNCPWVWQGELPGGKRWDPSWNSLGAKSDHKNVSFPFGPLDPLDPPEGRNNRA